MDTRNFITIIRGLSFSTLLLAVAGCTAVASVEGAAAPKSRDRLTSTDRALAQKTFQNALETSTSGKGITWQNSQTGASGSITPVKTWKTSTGVYCRSYKERIRLGSGQFQNSTGTACRNKSAIWKTA